VCLNIRVFRESLSFSRNTASLVGSSISAGWQQYFCFYPSGRTTVLVQQKYALLTHAPIVTLSKNSGLKEGNVQTLDYLRTVTGTYPGTPEQRTTRVRLYQRNPGKETNLPQPNISLLCSIEICVERASYFKFSRNVRPAIFQLTNAILLSRKMISRNTLLRHMWTSARVQVHAIATVIVAILPVQVGHRSHTAAMPRT
jgi:hypothetical protein